MAELDAISRFGLPHTPLSCPQFVGCSPVRRRNADKAIGNGPLRSLQIGFCGDAVRRYVDEWLVHLTDMTALSTEIHKRVLAGDLAAAQAMLPVERDYPPPTVLQQRLLMN